MYELNATNHNNKDTFYLFLFFNTNDLTFCHFTS
jgi:hypothetical protein